MKSCVKLGLIVLIACFFTVGTVGAVSEWKFGETVQLIVTTTNMGDVDVVRSTGTITIRDPWGRVFPCDDFDVEGVVHPGEAVRVPVNWPTAIILENATWIPGYYDIILDGELAYANGEYETTHSEVNDAFRMYLESTGLRELPEIEYVADISGITQLSDTYYPGSTFMIIVWVNNTGSTVFIPEVHVNFSCEDDYTFEPEPRCYHEDECKPGSHPYMYQCQLPEDMPTGTCEYDVDLQMYCIEVEVTNDNYPDGLPGFWHDNYVFSEVGSEPDDDWYQFTLAEEPAFVTLETMSDCIGYYDVGSYLEDAGYWPDDDLGYGYCFNWFLDGVQTNPDPDMERFCEESGYDDSLYYSFIDDLETAPETPVPWEWTPTFGDEGYHNVLVEIRERTATDIEASDLVAVLVDRKTDDDEFSIYVWLTNYCDYAFEPEFTLTVPLLGDQQIPITEVDDQKIAPMGESLHKFTIDRDDLLSGEEYYYITVDPVEAYDTGLSEDFLNDEIPWKFMEIPGVYIPDDRTYDEKLEDQSEANSIWRWTVTDDEWSSAGPHKVVVEVTDSLYDPDYSGDGDRIGYATLDVTITDEDSPEGGTDDGTEGPEEGDSSGETGDTGDSGSTTGSEPEDWEEPEDETGGGGISDMIQSFINQILEILRGILG